MLYLPGAALARERYTATAVTAKSVVKCMITHSDGSRTGRGRE